MNLSSVSSAPQTPPMQPVAIDWKATKDVLVQAQRVTNALYDSFTAKGGARPTLAAVENAAKAASFVSGELWASGAQYGCLYGKTVIDAHIQASEGASQLFNAGQAMRSTDGVVDEPGLERATTIAKTLLDGAVANFDVLERAGYPVA